jgi:hypothetical protein
MSVDEGSSLHEGFKGLMVQVTGRHGFGDGSIWWIGAYLFVLGAVGTRLLLDMRECRSSTSALLAAAGCYLAAVATQLGWLVALGSTRAVMIEEGCELVGNLILLLAMSLHARHVLLSAQGLLPAKKAKADKPPKAKKALKEAVGDQPPAKVAAAPTAESRPTAAKPVAKGALASKIASAKAATKQANETAPKRSWFGRSKVDAAHAVPPPAKMTDTASARTATAAIKTDGRKAASSDDYEFELDDDDRPRKGGSNGRRASDAEFEANERRMSKAERKALRRQQRERYEQGDEG